MKIQKLTEAHRSKAYALLRRAFPGSEFETGLVQKLHENDRPLHEWVCLQTGKAIAYIAFSQVYHGRDVCGLHLAPLAVSPDFQRQGVGSELLRFALRQEAIKTQPLFVLGAAVFFQKFGFEPCSLPLCPYTKDDRHFLSMGNADDGNFTLGYEPEFKVAPKAQKPEKKPRPARVRGKKRC